MQESRYIDVGTPLVIELQTGACICGSGVYIDITGASKTDIVFLLPDGSTFTRSGTFWTDPNDNHNKLKYILQSGDLTQVGVYRVQAQVDLLSPSGSWSSEEGEFKVFRKLGV